MQLAVFLGIVALFAVVVGLLWADARRQLAVDDTTPRVLLGEPIAPPDDTRIAALELCVEDLRRQITPPRQIPVVELWLMDANEKTIEHTLHVATRLRDPEIYLGGMLYRAARETQPGYWIYRRTT